MFSRDDACIGFLSFLASARAAQLAAHVPGPLDAELLSERGLDLVVPATPTERTGGPAAHRRGCEPIIDIELRAHSEPETNPIRKAANPRQPWRLLSADYPLCTHSALLTAVFNDAHIQRSQNHS